MMCAVKVSNNRNVDKNFCQRSSSYACMPCPICTSTFNILAWKKSCCQFRSNNQCCDEVHSFSLLGINREVSFYPDIKKAE